MTHNGFRRIALAHSLLPAAANMHVVAETAPHADDEAVQGRHGRPASEVLDDERALAGSSAHSYVDE